jgi:hypothetical protein
MAKNSPRLKIESRFLKSFFKNLALAAREERTKPLFLVPMKRSIDSTEHRPLITPHRKLIPLKQKSHRKMLPIPLRRTIQPRPEKISLPLASTETPKLTALGKIQPLLSNPEIHSIESLGPNKPVIINKRGMTKVTKLILTESEIKKLMEEISEKTRIPLLPGLFRAALGSLHVTAVVSEHVGTRFIIEKRRRLPVPHTRAN